MRTTHVTGKQTVFRCNYFINVFFLSFFSPTHSLFLAANVCVQRLMIIFVGSVQFSESFEPTIQNNGLTFGIRLAEGVYLLFVAIIN